MAQYEDIKTSTIAIIGVIGSLVIFVLITLLMVLYQGAWDRQTAAKNLAQPYAERDSLNAQQQSLLNEYKWLKEVETDGAKREVYAIPIDRAMELVVADLSAPAAGEKKPVASESKPPAGEQKPATGEKKPAAGGDAKPAGGDGKKPAAGEEEKPAAKPAEASQPDDAEKGGEGNAKP